MEIRNILLVDDEADIRTVAELCLRELGGFTVVLAASGPEALEVLAGASFDLVLLDVMMPGTDGPTTLASLRAAGVHTPVVFMTAKVGADEVARYRALGVVAVIAKPFDVLALPAQIRAIGERL
ncbi:MAG: response regulator [Myxococcales bacterium]|nr:response regulator [Myxococcales bacterium]